MDYEIHWNGCTWRFDCIQELMTWIFQTWGTFRITSGNLLSGLLCCARNVFFTITLV